MNNFIKCPICHHNANHTIYSSEWGREEEYIHCDMCNYDFEFAYGYYSERVGNKQFVWSYKTPFNKMYQNMKKILKAEFMARRNWNKHKKKTIGKKYVIL